MRPRLLLAMSVLLSIVASGEAHAGVGPRDPQEIPWRVRIEKPHPSTWTPIVLRNRPIFLIDSEKGIGKATLHYLGDREPRDLTLRFQLRGLEQFVISGGGVRVKQSLDRKRGRMGSLVIETTDDEDGDLPFEFLGKVTPEIRVLNDDGEKLDHMPAEGALIEIRLPAALLSELAKTDITISWVDFFR